MASVLSCSTARASLLRLPPHTRTSAYQHSINRPFSATTSRKSLVDLAVAPPTYLLDTLHGLGIPWYAAIPASAVAVRGLVVYYFSVLPSRKAAQVQSQLTPLAAVHATIKQQSPEVKAQRRDWHEQQEKGNPLAALMMSRIAGYIRKQIATQQELHRLGKVFRAPRWTGRGYLGFGMLIAMTEALRMKCGSREGLLPVLLSPFQAVGRIIDPAHFPPLPPPAPTMSVDDQVESLEKARVVGGDGSISYDLTQLPSAPEVEKAYSAYLDPSLTHEGLGWCMDLSMPDPTLMLPLTASLLLAYNIIFRQTVGRPNAGPPKSPSTDITTTPTPPLIKSGPFGGYIKDTDPAVRAAIEAQQTPKNLLGMPFLPPVTNLQRIGLCFTILFGFAMMKMPAAILLYFVPSMLVGRLQQRWLMAKYPIRSAIQPCRRPLRLRVRKAWSD